MTPMKPEPPRTAPRPPMGPRPSAFRRELGPWGAPGPRGYEAPAWQPPPDDLPSARAITIAAVGLGLMASAAVGFFVWTLSGQRSIEVKTALSSPSSAPDAKEPEDKESAGHHVTLDGKHQVEVAFAFGPKGEWPEGAAAEGAQAVDDAAGSCLPDDKAGGGVKAVFAEEGQGDGKKLRLLALDYRAATGVHTKLYGFASGGGAPGVFDETGARSCSTGWVSPLPSLRRTSKFDPKRMHPILHKITPHEGTDFGAPMKTPVYAAYRGIVSWVGPHGGHGNWVAVMHPDGTETGYAHLSKFADGIKKGDVVSPHQLVGYVGSTGRSTGPHLHFSAKKAGVWFDAETLLKPPSHAVGDADKAAFAAQKAHLDPRLDAVKAPGAAW